jgi:hypothetical protein
MVEKLEPETGKKEMVRSRAMEEKEQGMAMGMEMETAKETVTE